MKRPLSVLKDITQASTNGLSRVQQFQTFVERLKSPDPDHMMRIWLGPAKAPKDKDELDRYNQYWQRNEKARRYNWNAENNKPRSFQYWLDTSSTQPALCDRKGEVKATGYFEIWKFLNRFNRDGYGVFGQPNPTLLGGSRDADALPGRAIFTESDGVIPESSEQSFAITEQLAKQAMGLAPDMVVTTFKSAHTYRIQETLYSSLGAWQIAQSRFTQQAREVWGSDTDESLIDCNQTMRFPGFNHVRWEDGMMRYHPVRLVYDSGKAHADASTGLPELAEPIINKVAGEDHDLSAFELGSFAGYLPGYKENGRKGWSTCKCPAHDGQSTDSLHINQATGQYKCQAGCDSKDVYRGALKYAVEHGYRLPPRRKQVEHWDYDEPHLGKWGAVVERLDQPIAWKDGAPHLLDLLPEKQRIRFDDTQTTTSPQAIALKTYATWLEQHGQPRYIEQAKKLIGSSWEWNAIPVKTPLWGWAGFFKELKRHVTTDIKKDIATICDRFKSDSKEAAETAVREAADKWQLHPSRIEWLDQQFFGDAIVNRIEANEDSRHSVFVYGPTGTGKTTGLERLRNWAHAQGRQFIYITPQQSLAKDAARKLNLIYRTNLEDESFGGQYPDVAACTASLIEGARGINWLNQVSDNAVLALDEVDIFMGTVAGIHAGSNAAELQHILDTVLSKAHFVVALSAQLKDRHIDVIKTAHSSKSSDIIGITGAPAPKSITLIDDSDCTKAEEPLEGEPDDSLPAPSGKKDILDRWVLAQERGEKVFLFSGSQLPDSKYGSMALSAYAEMLGADGVLRVDSQSTRDPEHPSFKFTEQSYNQKLQSYQTLIGTASMQAGVSLEFGKDLSQPGYYTQNYVLDSGALQIEQLIQAMGRDRHPTPVTATIASGSKLKEYGGTTDSAEVKQTLGLLANQKETQLLRFTALARHKLDWANHYLEFYCQDVAQSNAANADKLYNLSRYLKWVGHAVSVTSPDGWDEAEMQRPRPADEYLIFQDEYARDFHQKVADAPKLDRYDIEELQRKDEYTLDQWYSVQQFLVRQALRFDVTKVVNPETGVIEQHEKPIDTGVVLDAAYVRQVNRDRLAKPWQLHYYAKQSEWDWFAHDLARTINAPQYTKYFKDGEQLSDPLENVSPKELRSLKSRRLSVLHELGVIDFVRQWCVDIAELDAETMTTMTEKDFNNYIHDQHSDKRFTKVELESIVNKLAPDFEETCQLLGVRSQRNEDGEISHAQVLTIIRNIFGIKTIFQRGRKLNGVKGVYVLLADDKALMWRKAIKGAESEAFDSEADAINPEILNNILVQQLDDYQATHRRVEMSAVWSYHLAVERHIFRDFLEREPYKIALLDAKCPEHWDSLSSYLTIEHEVPTYIKPDAWDSSDETIEKAVELDALEPDENPSDIPSLSEGDHIEFVNHDGSTNSGIIVEAPNPHKKDVFSQAYYVKEDSSTATHARILSADQLITVSQDYPTPDYVKTTPGLGWEAAIFESDLINAQTIDELNAAKQRTPVDIRSAVMEIWQQDNRFDWLKKKAEVLSA
ncbi:hypothetical protein D0962_37765 [Leptolyngbyaceae cyanobacterium CCMR0082]|uniref:ORC1/DEAH AAA+ ATPase domain-containing protein n=1 Tax=Adonisia turfae CCMR0082 TaxID=2304604 RepID=A0A6M0SKM7_9CYAN|nr:AAA family ATPase [Adonisia turfae]NEZ68401.1 hypothetical protein [Adonisia turfae CCMR0082]